MNVSVASRDITAQVGSELSGFAARIQPSTGILDKLFAKALFIQEGSTRLLWINCDLIGLDESIIHKLRTWATKSLGLNPTELFVSTTHTHSGPATIHLKEAGEYDSSYVETLIENLKELSREVFHAKREPCDLIQEEGHLNLAIDRRNQTTSHTDPRVLAIGFKRKEGTFIAAVINYAIHPVALGSTNCAISADIFAHTATHLSQSLPGNPLVLVTNGACGNLNPPSENVAYSQVISWGQAIANAVIPQLLRSQPEQSVVFKVAYQKLPLALDILDAAGIEAAANRALRDEPSLRTWGDKFIRVVNSWKKSCLSEIQSKTFKKNKTAEIYIIRFNDTVLFGANAELFSEITDQLSLETNQKVYVIGYANGDMGYLPTQAAYYEGGYEVEIAHLFYGGFRFKEGSLELLARSASDFIKKNTP